MAQTPDEILALLTRRTEIVRADLLMKFEVGDYHGVADAAMDLREIEAQLEVLKKLWTGGISRACRVYSA